MKAIFLISLIFLASTTQATKDVDFYTVYSNFFNQLKLSGITKTVDFTLNEVKIVSQLAQAVIDNFNKATTITNVADSISKSGEFFEALASSVVKVFQDMQLNHDVSIILDGLNDVIKNPSKFANNVYSNIVKDPKMSLWVIYNCVNLANIGDNAQLGIELGKTWAMFILGEPYPRTQNDSKTRVEFMRLLEATDAPALMTPAPKSNLRSLSIGISECLNDVFNTAMEIWNLVKKDDVSPKEIFSAIVDAYNVIVKCFAS